MSVDELEARRRRRAMTPIECPVRARMGASLREVIEREKGPCTGGVCLCGATAGHFRTVNGKVSCGFCRPCLEKGDPEWRPLPPAA